jgi:protein-S-isoprenylcysteine O-methyltransferase Ste14
MHLEEPRARIGHRVGALSQAKALALKALVVLGGVTMLVSAFAISLVFIAIGLCVVLVFGGYLWWKTRDLRRQMRAGMQAPPQAAGEVIEGEAIEVEVKPR